MVCLNLKLHGHCGRRLNIVKWPKIICISGDHEYIAGPYEQRNNWQLVTNLTSGQTYEIRVVAKSGNYISPSPPRVVTTTGTAGMYRWILHLQGSFENMFQFWGFLLPYKWGFFSREPNFTIFFQIGGICFSSTLFSRSWILAKINFLRIDRLHYLNWLTNNSK